MTLHVSSPHIERRNANGLLFEKRTLQLLDLLLSPSHLNLSSLTPVVYALHAPQSLLIAHLFSCQPKEWMCCQLLIGTEGFATCFDCLATYCKFLVPGLQLL